MCCLIFFQFKYQLDGRSEAQARRGEEPDVDPEQFQDPDNEYGLFAGTTYEADDEEADKIYEQVDRTMDARRRARREAREEAELAKHRAERPKLQQQFADLKRGLAVVTDAEWENIPDVGNLTRRKRRREERSFAVPDSIIVGDRAKGEHENSLDPRQQVCFTPVVEQPWTHGNTGARWIRDPGRFWHLNKLC